MGGGFLEDGTVVDSNLRVSVKGSADVSQRTMTSLQIGQIVKIHYVDETPPGNLSGQHVEYDVVVSESRRALVTYRNVRAIDPFGSTNNFQETVLNTNADPKAIFRKNADIQVGAWVLVACLNGRKDQPVIVACVQHPDLKSKIASSPVPEFKGAGNSGTRDADMKKLPTLLPGAKQEDGQRLLGEFNGLRWNINKDGEFTVMMQGVKDAKGNLTNPKAGSILKFDKTGRITVIDRLDQHITISPDDSTITLADGQSDPDSIIIARSDKTIRIRANGKVILQEAHSPILVGGPNCKEPLVLGNQLSIFLTTFLNSLGAAFQALAAVSVGAPLGVLKPGFVAAALACTTAATQVPTLFSQKAFTEKGP